MDGFIMLVISTFDDLILETIVLIVKLKRKEEYT